MGRPKVSELTERELEVMHVFWEGGEQSIADAQGSLEKDGRSLAYTTVATLVKILEEKGFVQQTSTSRPHRFRPVRSFKEVSGRLIGDLVKRVFGGSKEALLLRLMEEKLSASERAAIEKMLKK
jgi:BlaI family transcriptional regulator, penicillinase repressor